MSFGSISGSTSMVHAHQESGSAPSYGVVGAIVAVCLAYVIAVTLEIPQHGTELIVAAEAGHGVEHALEHGGADAAHVAHSPAIWTVIPFVLLLGAIAILPLIPAAELWWESNVNRLKVSAALAVVTLLYYGLLHSYAIEAHWAPVHGIVEPATSGFNWAIVRTVIENAILSEFIPFITLLFSLYVISGGIRISGDLRANPATNVSFIAAGGLLASFIGTTGAAMLLIRPLLETNKERKHVVHSVVFFIFVVCNCGGCLLPIGDPPLFLGYLQGVSFTWTLFSLWEPWLLVNGMLLAIYFAIDRFWYYPHESVADRYRDETHTTKLTFAGLALNLPLLIGVVFAVALLDPSKPLPGTDWHAWMYLREIVQLALVGISLWFGSSELRRQNSFSYHAIVEVAALFVGIFICMQPALQILNEHGDELGIRTPAQFFWITGGLSSVLDNAPTYLVFFQAAASMPLAEGQIEVGQTGVAQSVLVAISLGAVFMGAMTYIGNGPNFMVRAIAEQSGVRMPSFFGYMLYSVVFLLPIFAIAAWVTF